MITDLLIRIFVRNHERTSNMKVREEYGKFAGLTGIATNFLLFFIKIIAGLMTGSIAVIADAVNNLTDTGSSLVTWAGFKISAKPADADHPYGHARMEYVSGLAVSIIVLFLGVQLLITSVGKILHPEEIDFTLSSLGILVIAIILKLWQYMFYRKISRLIDSSALLATSADSRNDVFATSAVLASALLNRMAGLNLDGYLGAAVSVFIIISGIQLIIGTISPLLGNPPSRETVREIYDRILSYDGIIGLHDLSVHNYGVGRCYASVHCEVPAEQDIMVSHDIIDNIERDFKEEMDIQLVIHLDPVVMNDDRTNRLKEDVAALVGEISPELRIHDFRAVWSVTHTNIIFDVVVPFEFKMSDEQLKRTIMAAVKDLNPSYGAVITIDHDYVPDMAERSDNR